MLFRSGKTTLLRALAVRLSVPGDPSALGYLPQQPYTFSLSVRKNLELGFASSLDWTRQQKADRVEHLLSEFNLEKLASQRANLLSGGEAQKLALARLLVVPRRILLLDEPTEGMDLNSQEDAVRAIGHYLKRDGSLMVLVSHHIPLIRRLTDELLFLDQGRIADQGPTKELLDAPKLQLIQRFLNI